MSDYSELKAYLASVPLRSKLRNGGIVDRSERFQLLEVRRQCLGAPGV